MAIPRSPLDSAGRTRRSSTSTASSRIETWARRWTLLGKRWANDSTRSGREEGLSILLDCRPRHRCPGLTVPRRQPCETSETELSSRARRQARSRLDRTPDPLHDPGRMRPDLPFGPSPSSSPTSRARRSSCTTRREAYAEALDEHRRLIRAACARGGRRGGHPGRRLLLRLPDAPGRSRRPRVHRTRSPRPIRPVGLHTGRRPHGRGLRRRRRPAARVAASGHGGQVAALAVDPRARRDSTLTDLGEHRLKDIDGPVSLFQLGDGSSRRSRRSRTRTCPARRAPSSAESASSRRCSSRSSGGAPRHADRAGRTGKTRLALEAAAALVPVLQGGVFWVGLAVAPRPLAGARDDRADARAQERPRRAHRRARAARSSSTTSSR